MKKSSVKLLTLFGATVVLFITVVVFNISEIRKISEISKIEDACGGDGIWLIDSATGKSTYVSPNTYVDEKVAVNETATTSYGINYSKEGNMSLEILDCIKMHVKITNGDTVYHLAYAKGSDGFIYLVETDENGNISRDSKGNATIIKRCDFADLYLGEE